MSLVRLGLRLAVAGGRMGRVRALLIVTGTAIGVAILLVSCAVPALYQRQLAREFARAPVPAAPGAPATLLYAQDSSPTWRNHTLYLARVARGRGDLRPPGVDRLPAPGEVVVSPALGRLLGTEPQVRSAVRGTVVGEVSPAGLITPSDLVAYLGVPATTAGLEPVGGFADPNAATGGTRPLLSDELRLQLVVLAFLGVPIGVLLVSVARLSATTRDRRLAALRLLGLTAGQTRLAAGIEGASVAAVGAAVGAALFWALRRATEGLELAGMSWFAEDLRPPVAATVAVLAGVPLLSVAVALAPTGALRRPLGVRRGGARPRPRLVRLVPLLAGVALLAWVASRTVQAGTGDARLLPWFVAGAVATGLGLPLAVPVVVSRGATLLVARGGPAVRIAARRLQLEPAATTRVVAGLLGAFFVCAGAQCVLVIFERTPQYLAAVRAETTGPQRIDVLERPGTALDVTSLAAVPGVRSITPAPSVGVADSCGADLPRGACTSVYVGTCADLQRVLPTVTQCRDRPAWLGDAHPGRPAPGTPLPLVWSGGDGSGPALLTVPAPAEQWPLRELSTVENYSLSSYELFLPVSTPGADRLLARSTDRWVLLTSGGGRVRDDVTLAAAALGGDSYSSAEPEQLRQVEQYRTLIWAATAVALLLGFAALVVTSVDRAIERRRQLAAFHVLGAPARVLRRSQLLQVFLPLAIGMPVAALTGLLAGRAYLVFGGEGAATPTRAVLVTGLLGLLASLAVAGLTVPGVGRRVTPELLRRE